MILNKTCCMWVVWSMHGVDCSGNSCLPGKSEIMGSLSVLGSGLFLLNSLKFSDVKSLCDQEVACSNHKIIRHEFRITWLIQFSLYWHKGGLKPQSCIHLIIPSYIHSPPPTLWHFSLHNQEVAWSASSDSSHHLHEVILAQSVSQSVSR